MDKTTQRKGARHCVYTELRCNYNCTTNCKVADEHWDHIVVQLSAALEPLSALAEEIKQHLNRQVKRRKPRKG